jgi:malate dehydrogenase (oxaloacetate-decarboxylating)
MLDPLEFHKSAKGKLAIASKVPLQTREHLSLAYTPGVAKVSEEIAKYPSKVYDYTIKQNSVAVVTDGTAVLGLGDIGPHAALPVMEGKCILLKALAGIDAWPICLRTTDPAEIADIVHKISPAFGGINLEDIRAPSCFEVEERLEKVMDIPFMHDDQHGTAITVLAALKNSAKVAGKKPEEMKIVVNGAGAAGIAVANMLLDAGVGDLALLDSAGITCNPRGDMNKYKRYIAERAHMDECGDLTVALKGADAFIGVSKPGVLRKEWISIMAERPIVFALANPTPEIMPDQAKQGGAFIVGTGRSDFPNQINNALGFPGIFRGLLDAGAKRFTKDARIAASEAIAACVPELELSQEKIVPSVLDKAVPKAVAAAVARASKKEKAKPELHKYA